MRWISQEEYLRGDYFPSLFENTNTEKKDDDDIVEVVARVLFPSAKAKAPSSLLSIIILFT